MTTKSKSSNYPSPLIFTPLLSHKTTLILLHGRGSAAERFSEALLKNPVSPLSTTTPKDPTNLPEIQTFRDCFPHTKFVFPTASLRRAVAFNRSLTRQWFDLWNLDLPEEKQHLQAQGLRGTAEFLHDLLRTEIEAVGPKNVVLMGLSQGCAAILVATLLWEGEPFAGVVGMCGWLPFRKGMRDAVDDDEGEEEGREDVFERNEMLDKEKTKIQRAVEWLRDEIDLNGSGKAAEMPPFRTIPLFMGHGAEDFVVDCELGRLAVELLAKIDVNTRWELYEGLAHWYSEDMLRDVVKFIKELEGWG